MRSLTAAGTCRRLQKMGEALRPYITAQLPIATLFPLLSLFNSLSWAGSEFRVPPLPPPQKIAIDIGTHGGPVHFPTSSPVSFDLLLGARRSDREHSGRGYLYLPSDLSTPVPAMVILHGSRGINPSREPEYARLLQQQGIASLVVDYYSARGIADDTPHWEKILYVSLFDIVSDAYASLSFLASLPFIDSQRVGVLGLSWGGVAARFSMDQRIATARGEGLSFRVHADFYGPCQDTIGTTDTTGSPLLTVRGVLDASNSPLGCARREEELRHAGSVVNDYTLEAGHNWDVAEQFHFDSDAAYTSAGCVLHYSPIASDLESGARVLVLPAEASRPEQLRMRATWAARLSTCMAYGYFKGGLPEMEAAGDRILLDFLRQYLVPK
jgi:dienelactone hydrolase